MTKEEKWINYCVEFENFCSSKGTMKKENKVIGWGKIMKIIYVDNTPELRIQKVLL